MQQSRRLAAIMFADIVGYTAIMQKNEADGMATIRLFNQVMETQVKAHQGELLEFRGDGSLCMFDSSVEAVRCAKSIQEALKEEVPLRIGIHLGDIVLSEGNIYGDGVNIASRVESLGIPGSVLITKRVTRDIKNHPEFELTPLGKFHFKHVGQPMEIFALTNGDLPIPNRSEMRGKLRPVFFPSYLKWLMPVVIIGLLVAVIIEGIWVSRQQNKPDEVGTAIAVLPFRDLSPNGDQEYFSDGISEELLNVLTQIENLKVASRTSSFVFRREDRNVKDIAELLGVDYILEGSVRKADNKVRISAQLIDASTDRHIWSETYDREMEDIFDLQDELAAAIVEEINDLLGNKMQSEDLGINVSTSDLNAYELYLKARKYAGEQSETQIKTRISLLEEAVQRDSAFIDAWAWMAYYYLDLSSWIDPLDKALLEKAKTANQKALELDPKHRIAQNNEAELLAQDFQWEAAVEKLTMLIASDSANKTAYYTLAELYTVMGYFEKAIPLYQKALSIQTPHPYEHGWLGITYNAMGQYDQATTHLVKSRELGFPKEIGMQLVALYKMAGQEEEIRYLIADMFRDDSISLLMPQLSQAIIAEGEAKKKAINSFWILAKELGFDQSDIFERNVFFNVYLGEYDYAPFTTDYPIVNFGWAWSPLMKTYRHSDHFKKCIKEAQILSYWRKHGFPTPCRDLGNGNFECD